MSITTAMIKNSSITTSNSFFFKLFFWLCLVFVAVRGLFSSCGERELLFVAMRGLLISVASLVAEHEL